MPNKTDSARAELERGFHALDIPEHLQGGILRYILEGIRPGQFLCAVVDNDLREAIGRADDVSLLALRGLVQFFYGFAPAGSHGSLANRQAWQEKGGVAGKPEAE